MMNRVARRLLTADQGEIDFNPYGEAGVRYHPSTPDYKDVVSSEEFTSFINAIKVMPEWYEDGGQTAIDGFLRVAKTAKKLAKYLNSIVQEYEIEAEQYFAGVTGTDDWKRYIQYNR